MSDKLNIQELIDLLVEKHGMEKHNSESFVREFFLLIEESLEKDKYVKIKGLGTFKLIDVESRESVNVNTGERFQIQGHTKISFTPEPNLKELVNKPFAHFETVVLNSNTVLTDTPVENDADDDEDAEPSPETSVEAPVEATVCAVHPDHSIGDIDSATVPEPILESVEEKNEVPEAATPPSVEKLDNETIADVSATEPLVLEPLPQSAELMPQSAEHIVPSSDASTMKYFIGIVVLVVLLCGGAITFMYYPDIIDRLTLPAETERTTEEESEKPVDKALLTDTLSVNDSIVPIAIDTVAEVATASNTKQETVKEEAPKAAPSVKDPKKSVATPFTPDSVNYTIVGTETTYTIKEGETLTKVALRFYGTKALWPYIVKHNPDVIKNPDNVPFGTQIKIPKLIKKQ